MSFLAVINPVVLINLILSLTIVAISVWGYFKLKNITPLYFGAAYVLFSISHIILLLNLTLVSEAEAALILIRIAGYLLDMIGVFAILKLVLEIRHQYTALADAEEMFRNPVEHSPVGVYLQQDGIIRYANPRFAEIFGFTREEVLNKPFGGLIDAGDQTTYCEPAKTQPDRTAGSQCTEFRSQKKDGTHIDVEVFESPMVYKGSPAFYGTLVDITQRKKMEMQITQSLKEKEVLLKEIHHRVKNNMQVISSLLSMQSRLVTDESSRQFFKESQNRVKSLALVHENLYRSQSLSEINYADYLKKIVPHLFESYNTDPRRITMVTEAKDIMISIDQAVPCSLMVNELVTNSLKYAFPGDRKGEIRLVFSHDEASGNFILDYRDNGVGIPPELDLKKTKSLGMQLVYGLTKQLSGTVTLEPGEGVHFIIAFPAGDQKKKET